jgi:hypothetical protein
VQATTTRPKVTATTDGEGVVRTPAPGCSPASPTRPGAGGGVRGASRLRVRRSGHDPGRVLPDLARMLADGGEAISDLAGAAGPADRVWSGRVDRDRVAMLDAVDDAALARVRDARAQARERAWLLRADAGRDLPLPACTAGGRDWPGPVLDVDATVVKCHSDKKSAAPHFKGGFGFHPISVWLDNANEALAGLLRPGNAGAVHRRRSHRRAGPGGGADPRRPPARAPRSWSAPTAPAPPSSGWPTSGRCATPAAWTCSSRSGSA